MSVSKCFSNSKNKQLKDLFAKKVKAGIPEEEAALAVVKEYAASIQKRVSKLKGEDIGSTLTFDAEVKTETRKVERTVQQQGVRIVRGTKMVPNPKGIGNRVIDLFSQVLRDPKYYNEMMTSIDNDTFKEGTTSLLETREAEDMDAWDPVRAIDTRFAYRTGGAGVAVSANSLSDHVLTQNKSLKMEFNQGKWGNIFMDSQFSENLTRGELDKVLSVINAKREEQGKDLMGREEAETRLRRVGISGTLSELTNAFVDIANEDAFVTRGNWGTLTNGYGMMMIRQGIHPHKVSAILRQPALVQLIEAITNKEGLVSNTPAREIEEEIFSEWKIKAQDAGLDIKFATVPTFGKLDKIDFDSLFDSAVNQEANTQEELKNQLLVLKSYIQSKPAVKKYNAFVTTTKNDAKGAGRNAEDMFLRQNKLSDAYYYEPAKKGQVGYGLQNANEKFFDGIGNNTLSYTMHVNTVGVAQKIINDNPLMFDSINSEVFELFNRAAAQNTPDKRVNNLTQAQFLFREYAAYKMSGFGPISQRDTIEQQEDFINDIMDLKSTRKYELLNKLLIDYDANTSEYTLKMERLSQKSPESKNSLTNSWRQIIQEEPALGDFLVRQAYRQSSFLPGPNQFHELIPFEWFMEKDYLDFLHSTQPLPGEQFLDQAVRKENATEFFKYIKAGVNENYYISDITEDVNRMGTYGKGNKAMGKSPKFAITGEDNTPVKLLGVVTFVKKAEGGTLERKSFAIYNPLAKSKSTEASYDVSHSDFMAQVDPEGKEYARELEWKTTILKGYETAIKEGVRVSIKDIGSLGIKFEGESFFTEPGNMVDLETEKGLYEARQSDLPIPEQMCG